MATEIPRAAALARVFDRVHTDLGRMERALREQGALPLSETVDEALGLVKTLLRGYLAAAGKPQPVTEDALELFKAFVRGDASLNAVRDNIRELVYYRNCLDLDRQDALPARPAAMAVRTVRHIYLYLHSRCEQEHRLDAE